MSDCQTFKSGGLGTCDALRGSVRGMILSEKGTTISRTNALIIGADSTGWASILAPLIATETYEPGAFVDFKRGYEVNSDEAEMTKSNLLFEEQTNNVAPKMIAYGRMSYSEYESFFAAHGKTFDIILLNENGNPILAKTTTVDTFKGFRGRIFVNKGSIPKTGADLQKECEFRVIFDDFEEWENIIEIATTFSFTDLIDICPNGLNARVTTAYSTPTVTIKVTLRNTTTPYNGVASDPNIQIVSSDNDAICVVTTVAQDNKAIGSYVVTLTAALNGPVWARVSVESSSRTYVSQLFQIVE